MATWLITRKGHRPMKYLGTFVQGGKLYYRGSYTQYWEGGYYGTKDALTKNVPAKNCKLVRHPGRIERKIRNLFKKLFEMKKVRIAIVLILVACIILMLFIATSCKADPDKMDRTNPNSMWGPHLDSGRIVLKESVVIKGYVFVIVEVDGREFFCPPEGGLVELTKR